MVKLLQHIILIDDEIPSLLYISSSYIMSSGEKKIQGIYTVAHFYNLACLHGIYAIAHFYYLACLHKLFRVSGCGLSKAFLTAGG